MDKATKVDKFCLLLKRKKFESKETWGRGDSDSGHGEVGTGDYDAIGGVCRVEWLAGHK